MGQNMLRRPLHFTLFCVAFVLFQHSLSASENPQQQEKEIELMYSVTIPSTTEISSPLHVFLPLAQSDNWQEIVSREIYSPVKGETKQEEKYGNLFWHAELPSGNKNETLITIRYLIKRKIHSAWKEKNADAYTSSDQELFLKPNKRVPVDGELIAKVKKDIPLEGMTPLEKTRAIYNYVVDNMEYKKVGTGWGHGDTHWACSQKYGNCTDFHALFTSLARSEGIPSMFEIGFPIPSGQEEGEIKGYHCWVKALVPETGWLPIDASEAKKHPENRELFFGTQPADRVQFSRGRDIQLGDEHKSDALNYFVFPHAESEGRVFQEVQTRVTFRLKT